MLKTLLAEVKQYKKASVMAPVFMVGEVVMEIAIPMMNGAGAYSLSILYTLISNLFISKL